LLHGDVLMWLMKTLLTSGCTNQRGAGHLLLQNTFLTGRYVRPFILKKREGLARVLPAIFNYQTTTAEEN
ncbi:hypothetical protein, partial [Enterobacter cloacae]